MKIKPNKKEEVAIREGLVALLQLSTHAIRTQDVTTMKLLGKIEGLVGFVKNHIVSPKPKKDIEGQGILFNAKGGSDEETKSN